MRTQENKHSQTGLLAFMAGATLMLGACASFVVFCASASAQQRVEVNTQTSGSVEVNGNAISLPQAQQSYTPTSANPSLNPATTCPPGTTLVAPVSTPMGSPPPAPAGTFEQSGYPLPEDTWQPRNYELDIHFAVPVFLSDVRFDLPAFRDGNGRDIVPVPINPGFGLDLRLAKDVGHGLSLGGEFAFQFNRIDDSGPGTATLGQGYLGLSARYAFLNASAWVPFVGTGVGVGAWVVTFTGNDFEESTDAKASLVAHALAGVAFELSREFAIEGGLRFNATTSGELFDKGFVWLSPFLGAAFYW